MRGNTQKGDIVLEFVNIENQLVDILTKPLALDRILYIWKGSQIMWLIYFMHLFADKIVDFIPFHHEI